MSEAYCYNIQISSMRFDFGHFDFLSITVNIYKVNSCYCRLIKCKLVRVLCRTTLTLLCWLESSFKKTQYVVDKFWSALYLPVGTFLCAFILCARFYTKVLYLLIQFLLLLPVSNCLYFGGNKQAVVTTLLKKRNSTSVSSNIWTSVWNSVEAWQCLTGT